MDVRWLVVYATFEYFSIVSLRFSLQHYAAWHGSMAVLDYHPCELYVHKNSVLQSFIKFSAIVKANGSSCLFLESSLLILK